MLEILEITRERIEFKMKLFKKILAGLLCLLMVLSVCGTLIYYVVAAL